MIALTLLSALAASSLLVKADPTDANIALARQYAPQIRFEKSEKYFASSVDFFAGGPLWVQDASGKNVTTAAPLTTSNLDSLPSAGSGLYLTVNRNATLGNFLTGQMDDAEIYTFVAEKANDVIDLYYWLFTPYNLGKSVPLLGYVGNHVGDWEYMRVRTVNGTATEVEYHAHGDTGSGTIPWASVPKFDGDLRPIGYTASGSHGFWDAPGTFTYVNAVIFKLQDVTSDDGVYWDTQDSLVVAAYPDTYNGTLSWLNYKGAFGNQGSTSCWWHFIYSECELVDGPPGPYRDDILSEAAFVSSSSTPSTVNAVKSAMASTSSHTLATVSKSHSSSYTVYVLGSSASHIAIRQTCVVGSDGNAGHNVQLIEKQSDGSYTKRNHDGETSYTYGSAAFSASSTGKTELTVAACPSGSAIVSYSLSACNSASVYSCDFSTSRLIRAYSSDTAVKGVQAATAITVADLDVWQF